MSEHIDKDLLALEDARTYLLGAACELSTLVARGAGGIDIEDLRNTVEKLSDDCNYYRNLWRAEEA